MSAVQRAREFIPPQPVAIQKARLANELKGFAREGKSLRVGTQRFAPGEEREANIALATVLREMPLRAGLFYSGGQMRYLVGTIGHSFEVDGITISLLTNIRTNSDLIGLSSFSVQVFDGQPKPFVDVFLDGVAKVVSSEHPLIKQAGKSSDEDDAFFSCLTLLCALKEFFRARVHMGLSGKKVPLLEPISYLVPSAWALPLHEFTLEFALDHVPNKEPFMNTLGIDSVSYPFGGSELSIQMGSMLILKGFCDHAGLDLRSLVSLGHIQLLYLHLFGSELIGH